MSRSRNIKPGFFSNEDLVELPYEYRLLYIGLWCESDREGRFEDRPVKLKMAIFPGDMVDVDAGLQALQAKGFILRYASATKRYGQIIAWKKHQNPHFKEQMSVIPSPESLGFDMRAMGSMPEALPLMDDAKASGIGINGVHQGDASNASMMQKPEASPPMDGGVNPADSLIPDSLIPDSLIPDSLEEREKPFLLQQPPAVNPAAAKKFKALRAPSRFDEFWAIYPRKVSRKAAQKAFDKLAPNDQLLALMLKALAAQAKSLKWLSEPEFIPHASTWINGQRWEDVVETERARAGPGQVLPHQSSKTRNGINDLQSMKTHEDTSSHKRLASERDHRRPDEAHDA